jgi:selenocysteine-specific translation elongation factor
MVLVVDISKGIQVQTAECIALGEILKMDLLVVLNKVDLLPEKTRWVKVAKTRSALQKMLKKSMFRNSHDVPVIAYSTKLAPVNDDSAFIMNLALMQNANLKAESKLDPQKHLKEYLIETILHYSLKSFRFTKPKSRTNIRYLLIF